MATIWHPVQHPRSELYKSTSIYVSLNRFYTRANIKNKSNIKVLSLQTEQRHSNKNGEICKTLSAPEFLAAIFSDVTFNIYCINNFIEVLIKETKGASGGTIETDSNVYKKNDTIIFESFHGYGQYYDEEEKIFKSVVTIPYSDGVKLLHFYCKCYLAFVEDFAPEKKEDTEYPQLLKNIEKLNTLYDQMVKKGEIVEEEK